MLYYYYYHKSSMINPERRRRKICYMLKQSFLGKNDGTKLKIKESL